MEKKKLKRKLRAIFSADVQGYSRLMGDDEVATVETITEYRKTMSVIIEEYSGRVVDSPGDNLLAEFASVVDAVQAAVEIQLNDGISVHHVTRSVLWSSASGFAKKS